MEADLLRYYRVELCDLWRGRLTFRRLAVLIKHLPSDSWTQTALRDESEHELIELASGPGEPQKFGPWALTNYQLALLRDELARLTFVVARSAGADKWPEPEPMPRPGLTRRIRRQTPAAVAYLKRLRGRGE